MTMTAAGAQEFATALQALTDNVAHVLLGKRRVIRLALTTMLAGGHLLLEDAPGTGKTSLARAIAASVQGSHSRIQFTPDLLPTDVTGVSVYDQSTGSFTFQPGPVLASIVLADEINRASPKTQSALLEVMEEGHVTVDGTVHTVGDPFMVIATQNPVEQAGTYRLPEAQLDRFLMKTRIGYPDTESAIAVLEGSALRDRAAEIGPVMSAEEVVALGQAASDVHADRRILAYVNALVETTRSDPRTVLGSSMRGGIALVRAGKVWAAGQGRHYLLPDDVKDLALVVLAHRLVMDPDAEFAGATPDAVVEDALALVPAPSADEE
ncbi:AAA family ATPase [Serinibacter salmoneus]|uniref:MoxR-like ATPase n=1 Tax=Serinibacter salmoneus TaxID=556530 RepID=A0A2A9D4K1_9MICO|nr:MoxR family ATPase [Serinibacter salmoneus]PFG20779.1 MoxR-like ATPase [Serinibacter salmoneus]